jgi:hypothetical protein
MVWISHPLGYYGLLAVGLVLCLYLFISVKKENALLRQRLEKQRQDSQDAFVEFSRALSNLENSLQEHERNEEQIVPVRVSPAASINLTKRSQALRMYRRGETAEQICSALQMPRNEVELLLKVQKALAAQQG